ncbi:MAG TPA: S41 family peptidase [Bacteroidales bacterium]|nr:S41 family peptidase [Bacteroidales bacterium]
MKKRYIVILFFLLLSIPGFAQYFGNFRVIEKNKLRRDLDILYQALDKFHSGMYWYTPKDSVDMAFQNVREEINRGMNVLEFHKRIAPLVALSREDHTNISLPEDILDQINKDDSIRFLPLKVIFLGDKLYCVKDASGQRTEIEGLEIETINGETPVEIVSKIGNLFASDGFIKAVKYSDLRNLNFSRYYYYYYGVPDYFDIRFKATPQVVRIQSLPLAEIKKNLTTHDSTVKLTQNKEPLELKMLDKSTAYLGVHTFSNSRIKEHSKYKTFNNFLKYSFDEIQKNEIQNLIIDVGNNGGGSEGNEGLLYSYFGNNYQKYVKVRAKTQKAVLDNGIDEPITLKTFGFWEQHFQNKKTKDGSLERRKNAGPGLMAFKKRPKQKFKGNVYIIISPVTYSGGSEFSNMMYSQNLATFVGQEAGGGYYGNTSGYSRELTLPNSGIVIDIPALQFVMNVKPKLPFGRGVIPHYEVIPTFEQFIQNKNVALDFIMKLIDDKK